MAVRGVFASDSGIVGDPVGDFAAGLLQEIPTGSATFFALTSGMPSRNATDTIINWFEETHIAGRTTNVGAKISTDTALSFGDASSFPVGTIFMVETTGEYIYATAIAGNAVTVVRGFGGTVAGAITDGGYIQRIATAQEEGSAAPIAIVNLGAPFYNFTQIFRNTWNLTGTAQAVEYYTGSQEAKTRRDAMLFHSEDIERALWFGKRSIGVKGGQAFRTMNGLDNMVVTNVTASGASLNYHQLDTFLQGVFSKNIKGKPNERIAFCGNGALQVLNEIARIEGKIEISVGQTDFGLNVHRWISPYGNVSLMTHPMFVESPLWTKDLRLLHPGGVTMRWLRRTFEDNYNTDGSRGGVDADYGVMTSEFSFEYHVEKTGGRLTGLTAAAAV